MSAAEVLSFPKPSWMDEEVTLVSDMANRFMENEIAPNYEQYEKDEIIPRSAWELAGENGLLCASMPEEYGGAGGTYAHEAAIIEAIGQNGVDGFGIALHSAIVAPYI
ncbi:MAG: acyl-CoA dehydrogenase family protein, partial [Pseudomonadota bacterium]